MPVRFNVGGGGGVTSEDVTATKAYVHPSYKTITKDSNDEVVAGTMPLLAAKTYTPGTANQTIAAGRYLSGVQTIKGDPNLKAENIKDNVTIFNVKGTYGAKPEETVIKKPAVTFSGVSEGIDDFGTAHVGSYALFAGGAPFARTGLRNTVISFNSNLVKGTATNLSQARKNAKGATASNQALFAGGQKDDYNSASDLFNTVDAYNTSLTRSTAPNLSTGKTYMASASVGDYALYAGGERVNTVYNTVEAYNKNLVKSTATAIRVKTNEAVGSYVGNYALFSGYYDWDTDEEKNYIDTYNASLTRGTSASLSGTMISNRDLVARNNKYALFSTDTDEGEEVLNLFNSSLVRTVLPVSSLVSSSSSVCGTKESFLFAGGMTRVSGTKTYLKNAVLLDSNLAYSSAPDLSEGKYNMKSEIAGDYILFVAGMNTTWLDLLEPYLINS